MSARFYKLGESIFANGWFLFVPYLALYVAGMAWNVSPESLRRIFWTLHVANAAIAVPWLVLKIRRTPISDVTFWLGLFLFLFACGAYLEYPSDAWEHIRRIFSWRATEHLRDNEYVTRFHYYFVWTFLSKIEIERRRLGLHVVSAFFEFLLAFQAYRLALRLGFEKPWAKLQALAFLALFGTNLFNVRMYALSSTAMAYIAYLQSIRVVLDIDEWDFESSWQLVPLAALLLLNHVQEFFFLGVVVTLFTIRRFATPARLVFLGIAMAAFGLASTLLLSRFYNALGWVFFTRFSTINFWLPRTQFWATLGLQGALSLLALLYYRRRNPNLTLLALAPFFCYLFPPIVAFFVTRYSTLSDSYRFLYLFPSSFALVAVLNYRLRRHYALSCLLVFLISLPCVWPWRGRLLFQLYQPPKERTLEPLDVTAKWFDDNRRYPKECLIVSDEITQFFLASQLPSPLPPHKFVTTNRYRLEGHFYPRMRDTRTRGELDVWMHDSKACALLVAESANVPPTPSSPVGGLSGHWVDATADLPAHLSKSFEAVAKAWSTDHGWIETAVPPFYRLYEKPEVARKKESSR